MALEKTERNGIVFIDRAKNQGYEFSNASAGEDCGDELFTQGGGLDLPVLQSYRFDDASQGLQLTAQVNIQQSLLDRLFNIDLDKNPPIRITTWNLNPKGSAAIDVFPHKKTPAILAETIRAKIAITNPSAEFAQGWPDIVAAAIIEEVESLKSQGGRGAETRFTDAVNSALYENQSPQQSLNSIMKLKTFCVQAGRAMLGLGTNDLASTFKYNFGASLLFNPDLYITEKGIARVSIDAKGPYSSEPELVCGKAIVIYNSARERASESLSGSNLSFSFRPDDTFSDEEAVKSEIMEVASNFSDAQFTQGQLAELKMTESNWTAGNGWTSDIVQIEGGLKVRTGLNPPKSPGAGVFNISFACNFGEQNGSLVLSNLVLAFTFDIAAYAAAVSAVQQMKARVRESWNNYKSLLASRALAHAQANKTQAGTPAPTTNVDLNSNANTTTNYTTRDQNAADALKNGSNITEGPENVTNITADVNVIDNVNDNKDGRILTTSDLIGIGL